MGREVYFGICVYSKWRERDREIKGLVLVYIKSGEKAKKRKRNSRGRKEGENKKNEEERKNKISKSR